MFKKGTDSITVYSCVKHNQDKSYRDAVIVSFLIRAATKQWRGLRNIPFEVSEMMEESLQTIENLKKTYPDIPLISPLPVTLQDFPDMPYIPSEIDIYGWIKQITAGLIYNAINGYDSSIMWDEIGVMSPQYVENNIPPFGDEQTLVDELQKWSAEVQRLNSVYWFSGWASGKRNPYPIKIYQFKVSFLSDYVYFKHRFYDTFDWYIRLKPLPNTISKLKQKVIPFN